MIKKKPFILEIIGEYSTGKSDFISKIPNVFMCDLTPLFEGDVIFAKYHTDVEFDKYYAHCITFKDIVECVRNLPEDVKTFAIDGSAYLIGVTEVHWLREQKKHRESALEVEYGQLYEMIRSQILYPLIKKPCNIVLSSHMKDDYVGGEKTGKRKRAGFTPAETIRDIAIYLYLDDNRMRQNRIVKNRFVSETIMKDGIQVENPAYIKELKPEASWESLIKMITSEGSAFKKEWLL